MGNSFADFLERVVPVLDRLCAEVGRAEWEVAPRLLALVRLRNQIAASLGFSSYRELALFREETDPAFLDRLLGRLEAITRDAYGRVKAAIDHRLARRFGADPGDLAPWDYTDPFFQAPPRDRVDLDPLFAGSDLAKAAERFYDELGLPVADILARSDLYERPAKDQSAFCLDVDRAGDIRILCNLRPEARWADTLLHELGHAVYDKHIDPLLPWLLRTPPHASSTEAVAMLLGRQVHSPAWLARYAGLPASEAAALAPALGEAEREERLVFARWGLVMVAFERSLYEDPEGDLSARWWRLVESCQGVRAPAGRAGAPDWAAKIHLATSPVYYHNYLLGELTAFQLAWALGRDTGGRELAAAPAGGQWLVQRWFRPGGRLLWTDLVGKATGSPLDPRFFAAGLEPA